MVLYIYIMASVLCVPGTQVVRNRTVVGLAENLIAVSNDYATHLDGGCVAFVVKARFPSFFTLVSRYYFDFIFCSWSCVLLYVLGGSIRHQNLPSIRILQYGMPLLPLAK